ncbi:hypothetical protein M8J77_001835 [Diaphorina citri]|nr:hypothetical protein M8J77_001835 [Diaphorina citri]
MGHFVPPHGSLWAPSWVTLCPLMGHFVPPHGSLWAPSWVTSGLYLEGLRTPAPLHGSYSSLLVQEAKTMIKKDNRKEEEEEEGEEEEKWKPKKKIVTSISEKLT